MPATARNLSKAFTIPLPPLFVPVKSATPEAKPASAAAGVDDGSSTGFSEIGGAPHGKSTAFAAQEKCLPGFRGNTLCLYQKPVASGKTRAHTRGCFERPGYDTSFNCCPLWFGHLEKETTAVRGGFPPQLYVSRVESLQTFRLPPARVRLFEWTSAASAFRAAGSPWSWF